MVEGFRVLGSLGRESPFYRLQTPPRAFGRPRSFLGIPELQRARAGCLAEAWKLPKQLSVGRDGL